MPLWRWSQTSSSNGNSDPTINFLEGQNPGSLNDSCRAVLAALAMYRDDISGAIVTAGSSTAYTVASNSGYDSFAHLANQMIAFTPHTTNGATVLLNVDGLGQKPLRSAPGVELLAGTIIQGTPYCATYNNSDGAFYLHNSYGASPYLIPIGAGMDYWGATAPNSSFALAQGQALSRSGFPVLFSIFGTTYGVGDGSTTFNIPDKTGRVSAMIEASATRLTTAGFGGNSTTLGAVQTLSGETETLTAAQLPANIPNTATSTATSTVGSGVFGGTSIVQENGSGGGTVADTPTAFTVSTTVATTVTINASGGAAHPNVQPTIMCNYILRVI
jgi:microcystin-dependent protein